MARVSYGVCASCRGVLPHRTVLFLHVGLHGAMILLVEECHNGLPYDNITKIMHSIVVVLNFEICEAQ